MIGVVEIDEAKRRAFDAELDLVEITATSTPPVVRIMDFGRWKYEQSKKDRANKAKSKGTELKEIRLGRSMKIDPHDIEIRLDQARRFLMEGHKVQIVQNFRGREMAHKDRGRVRMQDIIEKLSDVGKIEMEPRFAGRRITMVIGPDRPKIERLKQQAISKAAHQAQIAAQSEEPSSPETTQGSKPPAEPAAPTEPSSPEADAASAPVSKPPPPDTEAAPPKPAKVGQG